ncbi:MAG: VPXXXP-CTERM sorting domain-containing protein, partial [Methanosarcinaceae archaeon]|nr:VPXXXP-CTERM sorting domain-containing protein [Methanosarcinaceae archaeon]
TNVGKVVGIGEKSGKSVTDSDPANYRCKPTDVPALTPAGLMGLIGVLGMIGIFGVKRRD